MPDPYLSLASLKAALGDSSDSADIAYHRALAAATEKIDAWCGRHFWQAASTARLYRPFNRYLAKVDDWVPGQAVTVKVDDDGDGVFEVTLSAGQWQAEPLVPLPGWPYTQISATTSARLFPVDGRRPRVQVTAVWGWPQIPKPVEQACLILAIAYHKAKDLTGIAGGFEDLDTRPGSPWQQVKALLEEYRHPNCAPAPAAAEPGR